MKRTLITVIVAIFLTGGIAIAGIVYTPNSPDGTVENREDVAVLETDTSTVVETAILTPRQLALDIAAAELKIQWWTTYKAELEAVKVLVDAQADKVVLKP